MLRKSLKNVKELYDLQTQEVKHVISLERYIVELVLAKLGREHLSCYIACPTTKGCLFRQEN